MPLYDLPFNEIKQKGYLTPWAFNLHANFLVSLPSIFAIKVLNFFYGKFEFAEAFNFDSLLLTLFFDNLEITYSFFMALYVPAIFTITANIAGWASLKKKDSNKISRAKSKKAYLYVDGTYGIMIKTMASLYLVVSTHENVNLFESVHAGMSMLILMLIIGILLIYQCAFKIPDELFKINGYSGYRSDHGGKEQIKDRAPFLKWRFWTGIGSLLILFFVYLVSVLLSLIGAFFLLVMNIMGTMIKGYFL